MLSPELDVHQAVLEMLSYGHDMATALWSTAAMATCTRVGSTPQAALTRLCIEKEDVRPGRGCVAGRCSREGEQGGGVNISKVHCIHMRLSTNTTGRRKTRSISPHTLLYLNWFETKRKLKF